MAERFEDWKQPEIVSDVPTRWNWVVKCPDKLSLGRNTDIGAFCYIGAHEGIEIGDHCQLGAHCAVYSLNTIDDQRGKVVMGDGSCVGAGSVVMPDVVIGEGAKVGALSFVKYGTRIPAHEIWGGVPAKKLK